LAWDLLRADGGITCRMPFKGAFPPRLEGRHDSRLAAPFLPSRILRPNTASAGLTGQTDRGSDRLAAGAPFCPFRRVVKGPQICLLQYAAEAAVRAASRVASLGHTPRARASPRVSLLRRGVSLQSNAVTISLEHRRARRPVLSKTPSTPRPGDGREDPQSPRSGRPYSDAIIALAEGHAER
jgi:hypothetical protein